MIPPGWLTFAQEASLPTLSIAAVLLAATALIKVWPTMRKHQLESDASLRADLLKRLNRHEDEIITLRKALARAAERQLRAAERHGLEIADLQHDLTNELFSLDAMILLAEANPEKVLESIPKIKQMRADHRARVALKRGAREAALAVEAAKAEAAEMEADAAEIEAEASE